MHDGILSHMLGFLRRFPHKLAYYFSQRQHYDALSLASIPYDMYTGMFALLKISIDSFYGHIATVYVMHLRSNIKSAPIVLLALHFERSKTEDHAPLFKASFTER